MLEGGVLVGSGCRAERADAGGDRLFCGRLRGGRLALRRVNPLADGGWARIVLPRRFQLVYPRADSGKALLDLPSAALPGLRLVAHTSRMPTPSSFATMHARLLHLVLHCFGLRLGPTLAFAFWMQTTGPVSVTAAYLGSGFPCHSLNRRRQVLGAGPGPGWRTGG
jgi:hypothetical protein